MKIKIDKIKIPEKTIRESYDYEKIDKFANSIKEIGLLNPITVKKTKEGYLILNGIRRFIAVKKLGEDSIECNIVEPKDQYQEFLYSLYENTQRESLTWQEDINATKIQKELYEAKFPETKKGIAGALGKKRKGNIASELSPIVKGFAESKAECEGVTARKVYADINLSEEAKVYPEILAEETKTNALNKLNELKKEKKIEASGDMGKLEVMRMRNENARLVRFTNRNHRNCLRFSQAETLEHAMKKLEICYNLQAEGCEYLTEAIFENGSRADIFVLDEGKVIEVCKSEEVEDCKIKAKKYPVSDVEIIKIKRSE